MMGPAKSGDQVKVRYSAPPNRGQTARRTGKTVLEFVVGSGTVIPGISLGVVEMVVGEWKQLVLQPQDAYGVVCRELIKRVPRKRFPQHLDLKVIKRLATVDATGRRRRVKIVKMVRGSVIVVSNHPLAGKVLDVEVELVELHQSRANQYQPEFDLGGEG